MRKRSNRMERRDNYTKALREEEEALRASMGLNRKSTVGGDVTPKDAETSGTSPKQTPIAPRWERAQREKDKKKKKSPQ